jgi:hypothetical protein
MTMQWEYKTISYKKSTFLSGSIEVAELEAMLNELGRDRWELVSTAPNAYLGHQKGLVVILKRQR